MAKDTAPLSLAFLDTETTGLDADLHEVWEVGLIIRRDGEETEHLWHLPVDLGRADPMALRINRFHERFGGVPVEHFMRNFCSEFADLTRFCHLVGAVPSFDEERLRRLLRANGQCQMWHYHIVDVEALAAGKLGLAPPWDSNELSRAIGVDPDTVERHTALGDARWAMAIYDAVFG